MNQLGYYFFVKIYFVEFFLYFELFNLPLTDDNWIYLM